MPRPSRHATAVCYPPFRGARSYPKPGGTERANAERMAKWLARGVRAGWNPGELSRRSSYPVWKLRLWWQRFARARAAGRAGGVVAIALTESLPGLSAALELITPCGHRVAVPADFDPGHLRRLLRALEGAC